MAQYDYLIVGAGLTGAVFAHEALQVGKKCLVIDRRNHVAGNVYTEEVEGIQVHKYGAHIFHTSMRNVWEYVNRFAEFNNYVNSPVAYYKGETYNLPFNMNTFSKMWGVVTPAEAKAKIAEQIAAEGIGEPRNLEEQALSLVGRDIFEKLVKGYTEKQWGRDCKDLPASIIKRLPCRFTYDNNYFNDRYQGIPIGGYTAMVERMLEGVEVRVGVEYRDLIAEQPDIAERVIYCGPVDDFYDFKLGKLEYRSLRFESELLDEENHQGVAVVNYNEREVPWTRIIEHKHFEFGTQPHPTQDDHHARVSGRLESRRRAVLPHQRRAQHAVVPTVQGACRRGGQRRVRRSLGRIQVLRHGQGDCRRLRPRGSGAGGSALALKLLLRVTSHK